VRRSLLVVALTCIALAAVFALTAPAGTHRKTAKAPAGIHKIKHVIVIMQENRSFDHYFGTYPGADGFPRDAEGGFAVCVPDPAKGDCQRPYHDTSDLNAGGRLHRAGGIRTPHRLHQEPE
jgi:Phosphoesterase family